MDDPIEPTIHDVIPELQTWDNGNPVDVAVYVNAVGNVKLAIAYGEMFWPKFVEHDGCVFFASFEENTYREFLDQTKGDKKSTEMVMNHYHILNFFEYIYTDPTFEQLIYLGRLIKEMWSAKLHRDFPARRIVVEFYEELWDDDFWDLEVTFYQEDH
jgi:hypothetical protein